MAIDVMKAIEIGRKAGLSLADCRSLAALAETEDQAVSIAEQFAAPVDYEKIADEITGGKL
jgi:hypothetical protein